MHGANLSRASLCGTNLSEANLSGTNLSEANLRGADLREADLRGAKVTDRQLADVKSLECSTMPDSTRYEEWVKSNPVFLKIRDKLAAAEQEEE